MEKFDLEIVKNTFESALKDDDDVFLDEYLAGYNEIYKFFHLMGSVFGFVSNDVKSKMDILREFREKENSEKFLTFKTMLVYEKNENLLNKNDYVSGSRTLLRLHRGLDFIREFLLKVGDIEPTTKTCTICQEAYNKTLANFHPWLIRKGATLAMHALPTRDQLLTKVCVDIEKSKLVLPDAVAVLKVVYDRTQQLYTDHDLHGLP